MYMGMDGTRAFAPKPEYGTTLTRTFFVGPRAHEFNMIQRGLEETLELHKKRKLIQEFKLGQVRLVKSYRISKQGYLFLSYEITKPAYSIIEERVLEKYAGPHRPRRLLRKIAKHKLNIVETAVSVTPVLPSNHVEIKFIVGRDEAEPKETE
jgi:hypothetical protein